MLNNRPAQFLPPRERRRCFQGDIVEYDKSMKTGEKNEYDFKNKGSYKKVWKQSSG